MLKLEIFKDYVIIEGVRIERPMRLVPSQWYRIWENLTERDRPLAGP